MGRRKLIEDHDLLAVARDVFVKRGFAASTREIARRAGISEAIIYQRHATKVHLFFAAMVPLPRTWRRCSQHPRNSMAWRSVSRRSPSP
jgi:Bacterial regulatory proteins, tetR family